MRLYNERLKHSESILDVKSMFVEEGDEFWVKIFRAGDTSFSDSFSSELKKDFARVFVLANEEQSAIRLTFEQFEDIYRLTENYENIIYWILCSMCDYRFLPDSRECSDFKIGKLKYDKKQFVDFLHKFPELFVDKFKVVFYSAIVDSMEMVIKYCKQFSLHRYCYDAILICKEYLDDLVAFLENRENVGVLRKNNAISQDIYFAKCESIVERAKNFEL